MTNENFNLFHSSNSTIFITVLFAELFMFRIKVKKLTTFSCASEKKKKIATTTTKLLRTRIESNEYTTIDNISI